MVDNTAEDAGMFCGISKEDANSLERWVEEFRLILERILVPEAQSPPINPQRRQELLQRSRLGRTLLRVSACSPLEFVEQEFRHDVIRAGLLFFNGLREIDLRLGDSGTPFQRFLQDRHMAQMCRGGSARLAEALLTDIREHGGEFLTGVEPRSILVRHGKAVGVELAGGDRIMTSGFVASGLNPQQTFLRMLDVGAIDPCVRERAEAYRYNPLAPLFAN